MSHPHLQWVGHLTDYQPLLLPSPWVAKLLTRFCHGIPPSTSGHAALHAIASGMPTLRNDEKDTCTETHMQHVWAETAWPCLE